MALMTSSARCPTCSWAGGALPQARKNAVWSAGSGVIGMPGLWPTIDAQEGFSWNSRRMVRNEVSFSSPPTSTEIQNSAFNVSANARTVQTLASSAARLILESKKISWQGTGDAVGSSVTECGLRNAVYYSTERGIKLAYRISEGDKE